MIAWLTSLLMEWGYVGLFIATFLSGTAFPFSSELILFGLIKLGLDPIACLISATTGNTLGGMTCYWLGHLGKMEWIERYLKVKPEKIEKTRKFLQGRGAYMARGAARRARRSDDRLGQLRVRLLRERRSG